MKTRTNQTVYGALGKKQVEDVKNIIQADKDVLEQIVYNEDEETITLPKHIMPLRLTINSTNCYFDYDEMIIFNDDNEYIGDFSIENDVVIISSDNDTFENPNVTQIDYILSDNGMEKLNTYYLYHPKLTFSRKVLATATLQFFDGGGYEENYYHFDFNNITLNPNKLYIITFNNTFIITPIAQTGLERALGVANVIINQNGTSQVLKVRVLQMSIGDTPVVRIKIAEPTGGQSISIIPTGYLIEVE